MKIGTSVLFCAYLNIAPDDHSCLVQLLLGMIPSSLVHLQNISSLIYKQSFAKVGYMVNMLTAESFGSQEYRSSKRPISTNRGKGLKETNRRSLPRRLDWQLMLRHPKRPFVSIEKIHVSHFNDSFWRLSIRIPLNIFQFSPGKSSLDFSEIITRGVNFRY